MAPNGLLRKLQTEIDKKMYTEVEKIEKEVMTLINMEKKEIPMIKSINDKNDNIFDKNEIDAIGLSRSGEMIVSDNNNDNNNDNDDNNYSDESNIMKNNYEMNNDGKQVKKSYQISETQIPKDTKKMIIEILTVFCIDNGNSVSNSWKNLLPMLITTYRDGMILGDTEKAIFTITKMFYPRWWLETVGYFDQKGNSKGILFQPNPLNEHNYIEKNIFFIFFLSLFFTGFILFFLGYYIGNKKLCFHRSKEYIQIYEAKINSQSSNNFEIMT